MNTQKLLSLTCLVAFATLCLPVEKLSAQSIPSVPAPTPGSIAPEEGPVAQITMDDGTGVALKIRKSHAPRVLLRPGHWTAVELWYDPSYAGLSVEVAAMDGGRVTFPGNRNFVAPSGAVILQFSDAQKPGLYRLVVNCGGTASTLRFWVPGPNDPGGDPSIVVPQPPSNP